MDIDFSILLSLVIVILPILFCYLLYKVDLFYYFVKKVDKQSEKYGGELVAQVLQAHGVEFIFTLVGGHISPILVAAERLKMRVIDVRHEVTTVYAADAVARLTGTIGVAAVTAGPGLTNTITAVKNAQMAESPVLVICGSAARISKGRGALQDIDHVAMMAPLCKMSATVKRVAHIVPMIRRAVQLAMSDTPGPVFLEMPVDVLYKYSIVESELIAKNKPSTLVGRALHWYINAHLGNTFAGAWDTVQPCDPLPITYPLASNLQVSRVAAMLRASRRPLVIVGSQSVLLPMRVLGCNPNVSQVDEVRSDLERLGAPCYCGGMSRGLLAPDSRILFRHTCRFSKTLSMVRQCINRPAQKRSEALREADAILLLGAYCDFRLSYGRLLARSAAVAIVNRSRYKLDLNRGATWRADHVIHADASDFLRRLVGEATGGLASGSAWSEWLALLTKRDADRDQFISESAREATVDSPRLNPLAVIQRAEAAMPDNTFLVVDGGDFIGTASYVMRRVTRPRAPLCWLDPGPFGTLGVGAGFALAAKLVRPQCEVWIVYGDGSLGYSIAEFDTFTRHKTPVIALVGNDAGWTQIAREQIPMLGSDVACVLQFSPYEQVCRAFGGEGHRIDESNADRTDEIIRKAQAQCAAGQSVMLNAIIGKTGFRDGSISM